MIAYPTVEDVIETNKKLLVELKVRRADKHEVLSRTKIGKAIERVKEKKGDLFDKAIELLRGLIQAHPFASGNRRTAFVVCQNFISSNGKATKIKEDFDAHILQGIRENYYTDKEIKEWLEKGEIHEFKRK